MVNSVIVVFIILLMNSCDVLRKRDNNLMEVQVSTYLYSKEELEQYDTIIAYHNLESLTKSKDLVECLSVLFDAKIDSVKKDLSDYIEIYEGSYRFAGYEYISGEDIISKTVYFNKYGYIIPYKYAVAQLKGNGTDVKIMRDDKYQRVHQ